MRSAQFGVPDPIYRHSTTSTTVHKALRIAALVLAISSGAARSRAQDGASILKLDPELDAIIPTDSKPELLRDGYVFLEGPVWSRSGGYLLFSNMPEKRIERWTPDGKISVFLDLTKFWKVTNWEGYLSNGLTFDPQGRLVYCSQNGTVVRVQKNGRHVILAERYNGKHLIAPNDLAFKRNGSLYFTDLNTGKDPVELPNSAYLLKGGKLQLITDQLGGPNGIALSADEKYLYVNDVRKKTLWRYEVQPDDTVANGRLFVDMNPVPGVGVADGMKVDRQGNIYDSGPTGLWIISPEGKHLGTIQTPDRVSNLAFGGSDGKTLFITLQNALYRIRLNIEGVRP